MLNKQSGINDNRGILVDTLEKLEDVFHRVLKYGYGITYKTHPDLTVKLRCELAELIQKYFGLPMRGAYASDIIRMTNEACKNLAVMKPAGPTYPRWFKK